MPVLAFGTLGGAQFLVHMHDDHVMHLHPLRVVDQGALALTDFAAHHGHAHPPSPGNALAGADGASVQPDRAPEGTVLSWPDHDQLPRREVGLVKSPSLVMTWALAAFAPLGSPGVDRHIGAPGGPPWGAPTHLCALRATARLVRTSRALLI